MIKSYHVQISPGFKKALDDANRPESDVFLNEFRLMDDGSPIVCSSMTEFPENLKKRLYLDQVLSDQSDVDKGAVDLDTAARNTEFLQVGIKNRVAKENQLSDQGIQLAQQISEFQ